MSSKEEAKEITKKVGGWMSKMVDKAKLAKEKNMTRRHTMAGGDL